MGLISAEPRQHNQSATHSKPAHLIVPAPAASSAASTNAASADTNRHNHSAQIGGMMHLQCPQRFVLLHQSRIDTLRKRWGYHGVKPVCLVCYLLAELHL